MKAKPPTSFGEAMKLLGLALDCAMPNQKSWPAGRARKCERFDGRDELGRRHSPPRDRNLPDPARLAHSEMLAAGWRTFHHPALRGHARPGHWRTQRGHVSHARFTTARPRACIGSCRKSAARHGRRYYETGERMPVSVFLGGDPVLDLLRHRSAAGWHGRISAGRLSAQKIGRTRQMRDKRPGSSRRRGLCHRGLCGSRRNRCATEGPFGDHTGYYSLPDPYPALSRHGHHASQGRGLSGDDRGHSADGGFLHRHGQREIVPADFQNEFPGNGRSGAAGRRAFFTTWFLSASKRPTRCRPTKSCTACGAWAR